MLVLVAALVFWVAYDGGGYGPTSRGALAVTIWWAIVAGVGAMLLPFLHVPSAAVATAGLLLAFAALTGLSALWADSAEKAFVELDRVLLYLGVYLVAFLAGTRRSLRAWRDGMALGLCAIAALALASRFFPSLAPQGGLTRVFSVAGSRLSYPVNYWNGLATLVALAVPLVLAAAVSSPRAGVRAVALAPVPGLACVIYLASSRGGAIAAVIGTIVFVALAPGRLRAATAIAVSTLGSGVALVVLHAFPDVIDRPLEVGTAEGLGAAFLVAATCLAAGGVYALVSRSVPATLRLGPTARWVVLGLAVAALAGGVVAAEPAARIDSFKAPPPVVGSYSSVSEHLFSSGGQGRWQLWQASVEEFKAHPALGGGAGSYEAWWAQHGTLAKFARDAHSLYFETLGELGLVGLTLLVGTLGFALVVALRRWRAADEVVTVAALIAVVLAFAVEAGLDWMWELTAVPVVAFLCLGLLTGPASSPSYPAEGVAPSRLPALALRGAAIAFAVVVLALEAIPLLAESQLQASRSAAARGDARAAVDAALGARAIEPWAASPPLQLALVSEEAGQLATADLWTREAIARDSSDWSAWLVAARIETKRGAVTAARQSLARARELNPRSPLFATTP